MRNLWKGVPALIGTAVLAISGAGCQTWFPEAGMTLPSPDYLEHPPQYIPHSPQFPLPNELSSLQDAAVQPVPAAPLPFP